MRIRLVAIFAFVFFVGCFVPEEAPVEWLSPRHAPYTGPDAPMPSGQPPEIVEAFRRFNEVRKAAGLKPVVFDAEMSRHVGLHCHYLLLNWGRPEVAGLLAHKEDPSLPGYTPEGARAASKSILASSPVEFAVDVFLNTLYHRVPIVSPKLTKIGIAWETMDGRHSNGIMLEYEGDEQPYPIAYPQDGQEGIPLSFMGETPDPVPADSGSASFPVTLTFGERVTDVVAALFDEAGNEVPVHLSTPEQPALVDHYQKNTVCLIAKAPFLPSRRYVVQVSATHPSGERTHWRWSFKTATPIELNWDDTAELAAAAARRKLARVTGPVSSALTTGTRGWNLGARNSVSNPVLVWFNKESWRSFTDAGIESHDELTGGYVSAVGEMRTRTDERLSLHVMHYTHLETVEEEFLAVVAPTKEEIVASFGRIVRLETAGVRPREPWNDKSRLRLATADGTYLSAYIAQAALEGHPGTSVESLIARSISVTGVLSQEGESGESFLIYVDRPGQWSFPADEPEAIDADEDDVIINARGRLVRSTGTVRNAKEAERRYFAFGSNSGGTSTTFVYVSDDAWQSLQSRGEVVNFEDLNGRRVEVLGVPMPVTKTSNIYVERGDQLTLLP